MKNAIKKAILSIPAAATALAVSAGTAFAATVPLNQSLLGEATNVAGGAGLSTTGNLSTTIGTIINAFLGLLGTVFVLLIIYAGFLWMTAQGEEDKVQKAKDILKNATIGLVLMFLAFAIANFIIQSVTVAI